MAVYNIGDENMEMEEKIEEKKLKIENNVVKQAFLMANYMYLYNTSMEVSILIPEEKRTGEGELDRKPEIPKSP